MPSCMGLSPLPPKKKKEERDKKSIPGAWSVLFFFVAVVNDQVFICTILISSGISP